MHCLQTKQGNLTMSTKCQISPERLYNILIVETSVDLNTITAKWGEYYYIIIVHGHPMVHCWFKYIFNIYKGNSFIIFSSFIERCFRKMGLSPFWPLFVCFWVSGYSESFSVSLRRRLFSIHLKTVQRVQTRLGQRSALNRDGHCFLAGWAHQPMKMQSKQTAQPIGALLQCLY